MYRIERMCVAKLLGSILLTAITAAPSAAGDDAAWERLRNGEARLVADPASVLTDARALYAETPDDSDPVLIARVALLLAGSERRAGVVANAVAPCEEANAIAERLDDPKLLARARNTRATTAYTLGRTADALEDFNEAIAFADRSEDLELITLTNSNLAVIVKNSGAIHASLAYARRALEAARQREDDARIALVLLNLSDSYVDLEQFDAAEEHIDDALEHARAANSPQWIRGALLQRAWPRLQRGRPESALAILEDLASNGGRPGSTQQRARVEALFAEAHAANGSFPQALIHAREAVAIAEAAGSRWLASMWRVTLARVTRIAGEIGSAGDEIDLAVRFAETENRQRLLLAALTEKSAILSALGDDRAAYETLARTRKIEQQIRSKEAAEQLALLRSAERAREDAARIAELEAESVQAEAAAARSRRLRNAALVGSGGLLLIALYWRSRSAGRALQKEVAARTEELEREANARRAAEEQLRELRRLEAIGQLTGGIAHDFGNLLTVVLGSLELLGKDDTVRFTPAQQRLLDNAVAAALSGAAVTDQLLAFASKRELDPELIDGGAHVRQLAGLLARSVGPRIRLEVDAPDDPLPVALDRAQFTTALMNIVLNARDAIDGAGSIHLTMGVRQVTSDSAAPELTPGEYVAISVEDDGRGMTADELSRAIEPFYSTKDFPAGSGLGLSMAYGFSRQSSGTVTLDSKPDHGTIVTMWIPRAQGRPQGPQPSEDQGSSRSLGTALVVEDQPEVRVIACAFLRSIGFETTGVANAEEARAYVEGGGRPRFFFVDIVMPGSMDGRDFAKWVRHRLPDAEILLTTGYAEDEPESDRTFPILRKPYRIEELSAYLRGRFPEGWETAPPKAGALMTSRRMREKRIGPTTEFSTITAASVISEERVAASI